SFDVGNQPAEMLERTPTTARVRLAPAAGLQYTVELTLEQDQPRLRLKYALQNVGVAERQIACWSLVSFARDGRIVVPFGKAPRDRRRLVLPWWTKWPQPSAEFGRDTLVSDANQPAEGAYKI